MKNYKISQIKKIKECQFSGFMSSFNVRGSQNAFLHLLALHKKAIKSRINANELASFFDENINDNYFHSNVALDIEKNLFVKNITRLNNYIKSNNGHIINTDVEFEYNYKGNIITSKSDIIVEYPNRIEVIKLSNSIPKLSYNATSDKNLPKNNLELFLLQQGGLSMFNNIGGSVFDSIHILEAIKPIHSAIYHLFGKADKDKDSKEYYEKWLSGDTNVIEREIESLNKEYEHFTSEGKKREANKRTTMLKKLNSLIAFDWNHGNNIISESEFNKVDILSELDNLLELELNVNSDKCEGAHCQKCSSKDICDAKKYVHIELEEVIDTINDNKVKKVIKPTEDQQNIIDATNGFIRTNACCGTGKSETTAQRFKSLIDKGVRPNEILGITFTNKGGEELRDRVSKRANVNPNELMIFTFNSFGAYVLNNEYMKLGFTDKPQIIGNITKVETLLSILRNPKYYSESWLNMKLPLLNMINAKGAVYKLFNAFNSMKTFGSFGDYSEYEIKVIQELFDEYNKSIWSKNKIDYTDQILLVIKLFKENPTLIESYGFKHIMTDEAQDSNKMQVDLLNILTKSFQFESLMNVGDTSQSIYSFAGASQEFMINFKEYFGEFTDLSLTTNFRSTQQICDLANNLDELNTERIDKSMVSFKGDGEQVQLLEYNTIEEEYKGVASIIKQSDTKYQDVAILARTKGELLKMQQVLSDNNIPSIVDITERNADNHNVRLAINLAQYINKPENDQYLLEYLLYLNPDATSEDDIMLLMDSAGKILNDAIRNIITEEERLEEGLDANESIKLTRLELYLDIIRPLRDMDEVCDKFIEEVLNSRTFLNISELAIYLKKHIDYNDDGVIEKSNKKFKAITLTTMHSSKGREWDTVFVVLDKLNYDDKLSLQEQEEERRLLFVGATRAMNKLYCTYQMNMDKSRGKGKYVGFVDEIKKCLN